MCLPPHNLKMATIRLATPADAESINDIYNHYVLTSTCTFHLEPVPLSEREAWLSAHGAKHPVIVYEENGEVLGWASITPFKERPAYQWTVESSVYIHHQFHGKGIGTQLMRDILARAKEIGHHSVIAGATAEQTPSIRLHESLGFVKAAHFRDTGFKFGRWLDTVYLQFML